MSGGQPPNSTVVVGAQGTPTVQYDVFCFNAMTPKMFLLRWIGLEGFMGYGSLLCIIMLVIRSLLWRWWLQV